MALFGLGKTPAPAATPPPAQQAPYFALQTGPRGAFAPIDQLLSIVVEHNCSDLHLSVGTPPCVRIHGRLRKLETRALLPEDMEKLVTEIATPGQLDRAKTDGSVDFAFSFRERNRFRCSVYLQKGSLAIAMRLIPRKMLSLEEIGMPPAVR